MDSNMIFRNGETGAQRMARFERENQQATEEIAKIEAEYHAKGYDKLMSMDEAEEIILQALGPLLDAIEKPQP